MRRTQCLTTLTLAILLAGCQTGPRTKDDGALQREAVAGTEKPVPQPLPLNENVSPGTSAAEPDIASGSGRFIRPTALAQPRKAATGDGAVTFNFENQPVQAVVKAILGDLLKQNYTIVPGVQGNISFSTANPVDSSQALPILETLLSWTNNSLVQSNGRYVVMPAKQAVAGNLVPSLGASAPPGGLQARLFPLRFISATEMQKLMKPFARADSVLLADASRNVLVMAGTPEELANYQHTVNTFDVDWLRGMSVGVFNLERASVDDLMPQLDKLFGPKGDTPLAGMLRFIPIERTNALVVISTQPQYLDEVGGWITKIDRGGGNEPQLFVYDVRNIQASDLAKYLGQIYGKGGDNGGDNGGKVGPGLTSGSVGDTDNANGSASGMGSTAGSFGSSTSNGSSSGSSFGNNSSSNSSSGLSGSSDSTGSGSANSNSNFGKTNGLSKSNNKNDDQEYTSEDGSVKISSASGGNQLLVRARPSQWAEIESAIKRLDVVPLQVQIETRILEVQLENDFSFGVQWFLESYANGSTSSTTSGSTTTTSLTPRNGGSGGAGGTSINGGGAMGSNDTFYYSIVGKNVQVAIHAMETSSNTKTLSAPSLVVLNNQLAHIQVGDQVPITSTSVSTISSNSYDSIEYHDTGVILDVQPRVNPGGLVFLNLSQQVSSLGAQNAATGNYTFHNRQVSSQIAVQSGQTVLLGGLITQTNEDTNGGIPWLNRIPGLGWLFGTKGRNRDRTELIVLITPKVITNSEEAKQITNEYQQKFESLAPLRERSAAPPPAYTPPVSTTPLRN